MRALVVFNYRESESETCRHPCRQNQTYTRVDGLNRPRARAVVYVIVLVHLDCYIIILVRKQIGARLEISMYVNDIYPVFPVSNLLPNIRMASVSHL